MVGTMIWLRGYWWEPPVDTSSGQSLQNLLGSLVAGDLTACQHERGGTTLPVGQRVDLRQLPSARAPLVSIRRRYPGQNGKRTRLRLSLHITSRCDWNCTGQDNMLSAS